MSEDGYQAAALDAAYDEEAVRPSLSLDRPVPRIAIHVFAAGDQTAQVMERVAADRRFAKAHVTIFDGGISAAAAHYSEAPTPNLMIIEDHAPASEIFASLGALAQVCDPGTKVIVVGRENDVAFYRDLMRQGINEYLVGPLNPVQVMEAVSALYVDPSAPPIGRVYAFVGARGGAGSSTIAHNVGWCIAEEMGDDTTIVDLDLPFGTATLDFNQESSGAAIDALSAPERLDDVMLDRVLLKCTDHLNLFCAPGTLDRDFDLDPSACERLMDVVRQSVPSVVLDLPHLWAPWTRHLLHTADEIVITATPDLASLRNTKSIVDLVRSARPNDVAPRIILNKTGLARRPEIPAKEFGEAVGIEPLIVLPYESQIFGVAANNGQMIAELSANHRVADAFRSVARTLTGHETAGPRTKSLRQMIELLRAKIGSK